MKKSFSSQLSLIPLATMMPNHNALDEISFFFHGGTVGWQYNQLVLQQIMSANNLLKVAAEGLGLNGFLPI